MRTGEGGVRWEGGDGMKGGSVGRASWNWGHLGDCVET